MTQYNDIVDEILEAVPEIIPYYKDWKETYEEGDDSLDTKLECLAEALVSFREKEPTNRRIWEVSLKLMEKHLNRCDKDDLKTYEIMFFEDILNPFSHIENEDERKQAHSLLEENLGPVSKELCKRNEEFWTRVITSKSNKTI